MALAERLGRGEVILLDGATGTELERRGVPMDQAAWCGLAALSHGDLLEQIHVDYIRAGAEVIITNTFASTRPMLAAAGVADQVRATNVAAVERAQAARDRAAAGRPVWIAGSISPMAPGADRTRRPDLAAYAAAFAEQAEILAAAGVDLIVLEMMGDRAHTQAAIEAAMTTGLPVWVGLSMARSTAGEIVMAPAVAGRQHPVETVAPVLAPLVARPGSLVAVMHSDVDLTGPALDLIRRHWPGPLGAYPNSGHFRMPNWQFEDLIEPAAFLAVAESWVVQGVQVIGGCCGIGPEHIRLLAERLPRHLPRQPDLGAR